MSDSSPLSEFVARNREEIDRQINAELFRYDGKGGRGTVPDPPPERDDDEREMWVENLEPLWNWAQSEGVPNPE